MVAIGKPNPKLEYLRQLLRDQRYVSASSPVFDFLENVSEFVCTDGFALRIYHSKFAFIHRVEFYDKYIDKEQAIQVDKYYIDEMVKKHNGIDIQKSLQSIYEKLNSYYEDTPPKCILEF